MIGARLLACHSCRVPFLFRCRGDGLSLLDQVSLVSETNGCDGILGRGRSVTQKSMAQPFHHNPAYTVDLPWLIIASFQDFMTAVSLQCKIKNHHPEWSNVSSDPSSHLTDLRAFTSSPSPQCTSEDGWTVVRSLRPPTFSLPERNPIIYYSSWLAYNPCLLPSRYTTRRTSDGRHTTPRAYRPRISSWLLSATA